MTTQRTLLWIGFLSPLAAAVIASAQPADDVTATVTMSDSTPPEAMLVAHSDTGANTTVLLAQGQCKADPTKWRKAVVDKMWPTWGNGDQQAKEDVTVIGDCKTKDEPTKMCLAPLEGWLSYVTANPMGIDPTTAVTHGTNAKYPDELKNTVFLAAVKAGIVQTPATYTAIGAAVTTLNQKPDDWKYIIFKGNIDAVGGNDFLGRLMMFSPARKMWVNFVIGDTAARNANDGNASILAIKDGKTWFADWKVTYADGAVVTNAAGNNIKCGQCHSTGYLKPHPQWIAPDNTPNMGVPLAELRAPEQALTGGNVTDVFNDVTFGGVKIDPATTTIDECKSAGIRDQIIQDTGACGSCHKDGGSRGPVYLGEWSGSVIERYVVGVPGHSKMPPAWNPAQAASRQELFDCLKKDYRARLQTKLAEESCVAPPKPVEPAPSGKLWKLTCAVGVFAILLTCAWAL